MPRKRMDKDIIFVLASGLFFLVIGYIMLFTPTAAISAEHSAGLEVMDGRFSYKYQEVEAILRALGETGRKQYTVFHIVDYFFLASYCLTMMSLTKLVVPKKLKWAWVVFPLIPAVLDAAENTLIEIAIARFPSVNVGLNQAISIFTTAKWTSGYIWFGVFIAFVIFKAAAYIKKLRASRKERENSIN